jgi:uncharacterized membrane protein
MRQRWLIIALIGSAALNLFLIGAAAGVIALGVRMAREAGAPRPGPLIVATQGLAQPARWNVRQMLRTMRAQLRAQTEQSRALRIEAWDALAGPAPDVAAIRQKLQQSRQLDIAARTQVEDALLAYMARQPPTDRAIFATGMRRVLTPPPPKPQSKPNG